MTEYYTAKHAVTGVVAEYPVEYKDIPDFKDVLIPTDEEPDSAACASCNLPDEVPADEPLALLDVAPAESEEDAPEPIEDTVE